MPRCEDFPCCGHEPGCCPNYDEAGRQTDMVCTCGARLPINSRFSICEACLRDEDDFDDRDFDDEPDQFRDDVDADADALRSAGFGTDEDYGGYEDYGDYWGD